MAALLEVLTRTFNKRPAMLARNQASLAGQDVQQTLLVDYEGRGVGWSYENMGRFAQNLTGRYIWILDDDDECICPTLAADLKSIVEEHEPDVVMVRMDHGDLGVLPDELVWGGQPVGCHIGVSAFIVRREIWQRHAPVFERGHYGSDFDFIAAIMADGPRVYWHDVIASRVQRRSQGRPE